MRILGYVWANYKDKKYRNGFSVLGIVAGILLYIVVNVFISNYGLIVNNFFDPFSGTDQIVQKGSNYMQIMPYDSEIDIDNVNSILNDPELSGLNIIPTYYKRVSDLNETSFISFNVIFGIDIANIPVLLENWNINNGTMPEAENEIIIGNSIKTKLNLTINDYLNISGSEFKVVGTIGAMATFIDGFVFMDIEQVQQLFDKEDVISAVYIMKNNVYKSKIQEMDIEYYIESQFSHIEYLDEEELDEISGSLLSTTSRISLVFMVLTLFSTLLFTGALLMLNIFDRKKELVTLRSIGISNKHLFIIIYLEVLAIMFLALAGIPIGIYVYSFIYCTTVNALAIKNISFHSSLTYTLDRISVEMIGTMMLAEFIGSFIVTLIPFIYLKKLDIQSELRLK